MIILLARKVNFPATLGVAEITFATRNRILPTAKVTDEELVADEIRDVAADVSTAEPTTFIAVTATFRY